MAGDSGCPRALCVRLAVAGTRGSEPRRRSFGTNPSRHPRPHPPWETCQTRRLDGPVVSRRACSASSPSRSLSPSSPGAVRICRRGPTTVPCFSSPGTSTLSRHLSPGLQPHESVDSHPPCLGDLSRLRRTRKFFLGTPPRLLVVVRYPGLIPSRHPRRGVPLAPTLRTPGLSVLEGGGGVLRPVDPTVRRSGVGVG